MFCSVVPTVNNTVLGPSKVVEKADLVLSVLTTKTKTQGHRKALGDDSYICNFNCIDAITGVCIY